jgi:hypothetical protein
MLAAERIIGTGLVRREGEATASEAVEQDLRITHFYNVVVSALGL